MIPRSMEETNNHLNQNQKSWSTSLNIALAVGLTILAVVIIVTRYKLDTQEVYFSLHYLPSTVLMFISFIALNSLFWNRHEHIDEDGGEEQRVSGEENGELLQRHNVIRPKLQTLKYLVSLAYLFAIGIFFIHLFGILSLFHCKTDQKYSLIMLSVNHVFHIGFVAFQLLFFQVFVSAVKRSTTKLKVIISILVATNATIWFTLFLQFGILSLAQNENDYQYLLLNCSGEPELIASAKSIEEISDPFILEYSILSIVLLIHIYPKNINDRDHTQTTDQRELDGGVIVIRGTKKSALRFITNTQEYTSDPGLVIGLNLSVLIIISYVCTREYNIHYDMDIIVNYCFAAVADILVMFLSWRVYEEIRRYHVFDGTMRRGADNIALLLSALFGYLFPYLFIVMSSLIAFFKTKKQIREILTKNTAAGTAGISSTDLKAFFKYVYAISALQLMQAFLNIISPIYQATVVNMSYRYKRRFFSKDFIVGADENSLLSAARLKQWLLFLIMINIGLWVSDSFILMKADYGTVYLLSDAYLGTAWFITESICFPIMIFYRIHASVMILNLWFQFNRDPIVGMRRRRKRKRRNRARDSSDTTEV